MGKGDLQSIHCLAIAFAAYYDIILGQPRNYNREPSPFLFYCASE